eukprot:8613485-Pyramimonas_sp.AAC.1
MVPRGSRMVLTGFWRGLRIICTWSPYNLRLAHGRLPCALVVQKWFTRGSRMVMNWFWRGVSIVRIQWLGGIMCVMSDGHVQAWFKSGSRVVLGWFWSGSGVVFAAFPNGGQNFEFANGRLPNTRVVQKWFTRGSRMVLGWFLGGLKLVRRRW